MQTTKENPFYAPITSDGGMVPVEQHRAVQEVQAAMIIAKKFPRDQHAAYGRIMAACERPVLAAAASYDYPKGKTMVTGPTIRLAEVMAQNWGNMEFGIKELSQQGGESEVQAFAWDLETNVRQSKTFKVPHKMKAGGSFKNLIDPRDIYEHVANMGARRLRACILGVIPGDIVDAAVVKCDETLAKGDGRSLEDMIRAMLEKFKEIEISQELIEKRLQHKTSAIVRSQLVELGKIYNSIKDGMSKRSDWFGVPVSQPDMGTSDLTEKLKENATETTEKPESAATTTKLGKDQEPDPWEKGKWWSMRSGSPEKGTGFAAYCQKHSNTFFLAPLDIQDMVGAKWETLYSNVPFPFVKPEETEDTPSQESTEEPPLDQEPPPENKPEVKAAMRLLCPKTNTEKDLDVCKNKCPYGETCRTYLEHEAEGEAKERSEMIRTLNGMSEEIQTEAFKRCNVEKTQLKSTMAIETLRAVLTMAYVVEDEFKM